jgi:hypothetical protein
VILIKTCMAVAASFVGMRDNGGGQAVHPFFTSVRTKGSNVGHIEQPVTYL